MSGWTTGIPRQRFGTSPRKRQRNTEPIERDMRDKMDSETAESIRGIRQETRNRDLERYEVWSLLAAK